MFYTLPDGHGLLAPVAPDSPAGHDIRESDLFLLTRDTRNAARDIERLRTHDLHCDDTRLHAQWQQVIEYCLEIIAFHSKDLDVCAWLIEALTRVHGLRGMADGFMLYRELLTSYGAALFPWPEPGDDAAASVQALAALNGGLRTGTVTEAINYHAVTGDTGDTRAYLLWQYRAAFEAERIADAGQRQQRFALLGFSTQQILQAAGDTDIAFYRQVQADCTCAVHALRQLDNTLAERFGAQAPPTSLIDDTLQFLNDAIVHLAGQRLAASHADTTHPPAASPPPGYAIEPRHDASLPAASTVVSQGRHQAIAQLRSAADYFRTMEPHSPIAASIERLVRWAGMSCNELMRELVPDQNAREILWLMAGIVADKEHVTED